VFAIPVVFVCSAQYPSAVLYDATVLAPAPKPTNVPCKVELAVRSVVPPCWYPVEEVALKKEAVAEPVKTEFPATERVAYGEVVPIPTKPLEARKSEEVAVSAVPFAA